MTCVGHPVVESGADKGDGVGFRARHGIPEGATLLGVLPGSRRSEVVRMLPIFRDVVRQVAVTKQAGQLHLVTPTVSIVSDVVRGEMTGWGLPVTFVSGVTERYNAMAAMDAALAASGTVTLELAMAGVPTVICYKVSALSAWLFRRVAKDPYASLINHHFGRLAIPECLQEKCIPEVITPALLKVLDDPDVRARQKQDVAQALRDMGLGRDRPSLNAARLVLSMIGSKRRTGKS